MPSTTEHLKLVPHTSELVQRFIQTFLITYHILLYTVVIISVYS